MTKTVAMFAQQTPSVRGNNNCLSNLDWARGWWKKNHTHKEIRVGVGEAGSASGGTIKKGVITLSFQPHFDDIWPSMAMPVPTSSDWSTFQIEFVKAYNEIAAHIDSMQQKRKEGTLLTREKHQENMRKKFGFTKRKPTGVRKI